MKNFLLPLFILISFCGFSQSRDYIFSDPIFRDIYRMKDERLRIKNIPEVMKDFPEEHALITKARNQRKTSHFLGLASLVILGSSLMISDPEQQKILMRVAAIPFITGLFFDFSFKVNSRRAVDQYNYKLSHSRANDSSIQIGLTGHGAALIIRISN